MNTSSPLGRGLGSLIPQKPAAVPVPAPEPTRPAPVPIEPPRPMTLEPVQTFTPPAPPTPAVPATPTVTSTGQRLLDIPAELIDPNPHQPRHAFHAGALDELVDSIRQHGILQPLIVTPNGTRYQLIAGERRFRAAQRLGLPTVPAIVRQSRELQQLEIAIVENVQREDLNPVEEALGYQQLGDEFGLTQEEIAKKVGKSRASVANALRTLSLPADMQQALRDGRMTMSHAKIILTAVTPAERQKLFEQIVEHGLPVRAAANLGRQTTVRRHTRRTVSPEIQAMEDDLRTTYSTKVTISQRDHRGSIAIEFYSDEELQQLYQRLK